MFLHWKTAPPASKNPGLKKPVIRVIYGEPGQARHLFFNSAGSSPVPEEKPSGRRHSFAKIIYLVLGLTIFAGGGYFLGKQQVPQKQLFSPAVWEGRVLGMNLWYPGTVNRGNSLAPDITAKAAYFVDIDSGQVLYQKNADVKLPIASLTKIMTVTVTLAHHKFSDTIQVSNFAASIEPDHMGLIPGEKLLVEELLYGVFLSSANDAAEALAENIPGGRSKFISEMNEISLQLGMNDTKFINPTGLEEDGKTQYSTALDVALMSRYLVKQYPEVTQISRTYHVYLPPTSTHQAYDLYSGINLLTTYPGVIGLKIGYTPEAGLTIVTLAKRGSHEVLGVILNSDDRRQEARELLDYSFKKLGEI